MEDELIMFSTKKRQELIDNILELLSDEKMSQVESYGILEHCKFYIHTQNLLTSMFNEDEDNE